LTSHNSLVARLTLLMCLHYLVKLIARVLLRTVFSKPTVCNTVTFNTALFFSYRASLQPISPQMNWVAVQPTGSMGVAVGVG